MARRTKSPKRPKVPAVSIRGTTYDRMKKEAKKRKMTVRELLDHILDGALKE
jgi:hypothetical protein